MFGFVTTYASSIDFHQGKSLSVVGFSAHTLFLRDIILKSHFHLEDPDEDGTSKMDELLEREVG